MIFYYVLELRPYNVSRVRVELVLIFNGEPFSLGMIGVWSKDRSDEFYEIHGLES